MYWVYVLRSAKDGRLCTGITSDLKGRMREHNSGRTHSTRARRPLALVYTEVFESKQEALARERYFKTPAGGALKQRLAAVTDTYRSGDEVNRSRISGRRVVHGPAT